MEKVLPTVVILGVVAMLMFSILPVMAEHSIPPKGVCPGGPSGNSPWDFRQLDHENIGQTPDANGNGWTCVNEKANIEKDDRIPKNPK